MPGAVRRRRNDRLGSPHRRISHAGLFCDRQPRRIRRGCVGQIHGSRVKFGPPSLRAAKIGGRGAVAALKTFALTWEVTPPQPESFRIFSRKFSAPHDQDSTLLISSDLVEQHIKLHAHQAAARGGGKIGGFDEQFHNLATRFPGIVHDTVHQRTGDGFPIR